MAKKDSTLELVAVPGARVMASAVGVVDELSPHVVVNGPADHATAEEIEDDSEVGPAARPRQAGSSC